MSVFQEDNGKWYCRTEILNNNIFGPYETQMQASTVYRELVKEFHTYAEKFITEQTARLKDTESARDYFKP